MSCAQKSGKAVVLSATTLNSMGLGACLQREVVRFVPLAERFLTYVIRVPVCHALICSWRRASAIPGCRSTSGYSRKACVRDCSPRS